MGLLRTRLGCVLAGLASLAGALAVATIGRAEPQLSVSGFTGVDWFGEHSRLGNSWAADQVPGTAMLVGGRIGWLALPISDDLALAVEAELAYAPAFTGRHAADASGNGGRMVYFAPVFEWHAHALLQLPRWHQLTPHLVLGGGGDSVDSSSPFMAKDTDPVIYWGAGASAPVAAGWQLRLDVRTGIMPSRVDGMNQTLTVELGIGTSFGEPSRPSRRVAPAAPIEPVAPPVAPAVTDDDPDGDGVVGAADHCPDLPEDRDGYQDEDGCPEDDNDLDGIVDADDKCPDAAETVNGFEDEDGCPDAVPADVEAAVAAVVAFEPGRARLTARARAALDALAGVLEQYPNLRVVVVGHRPRSGSRDLADRRAAAARWYLVDQGIAEDRLVVRRADSTADAVAFELAVSRR